MSSEFSGHTSSWNISSTSFRRIDRSISCSLEKVGVLVSMELGIEVSGILGSKVGVGVINIDLILLMRLDIFFVIGSLELVPLFIFVEKIAIVCERSFGFPCCFHNWITGPFHQILVSSSTFSVS